MLSLSSVPPYIPDIPMQPSPIALTVGPVAPSRRVVIVVIRPACPARLSAGGPHRSGDRQSLAERRGVLHSGGMDRAGLADFLRRRRERLSPGDVGCRRGCAAAR